MAVNIRDDMLDAIRNTTTIADADSWRRVIRTAPLAERKSLTHLYEAMTELAREMKGVTRDAFIYNARTGACIYYDLERTGMVALPGSS